MNINYLDGKWYFILGKNYEYLQNYYKENNIKANVNFNNYTGGYRIQMLN